MQAKKNYGAILRHSTLNVTLGGFIHRCYYNPIPDAFLMMDYIYSIEEIRMLLRGADYVGVTSVEAELDLEAFLTQIFAYRPGLIRFLYRIRGMLVVFLGFKQDSMPPLDEWMPEEFPMLPCGVIWFFTVWAVKQDQYWIAGCPRDRHLDADLGVVVEPVSGCRRRFHMITVVRYKHWTGPVYFNLIRIFNLLLINRMANSVRRMKK